jgi:deoxycytidylate deaminase
MKIQYPYMPEGRTIESVSIDNVFMKEARRIRDTQSTDLNHSTGAVVVKDNIILGGSANQAGFKNSILIGLHGRGWCMRKLLKIKSGTKYWLCPGCSTHKDHAESGAVRNAIDKAGSEKVSGSDVYLYGHWWCCKPCWDNMIGAGVKKVFVVDEALKLFGKK